MHVLEKIICFFVRLIPIRCVQKLKSMAIVCSVAYNAKKLKKESKYCGASISIYKPLSLKGIKYMEIGDNFKLDVGGIMEAWDIHNGIQFHPKLKIGSNVSFGKHCHIGCINFIEIGDGVLIGSFVLITDHAHGKSNSETIMIAPNKRNLYSKGTVYIGNNVWIGEKVTILPNVKIGENSIIGANSVVTGDIPANVVACGNPAVVVKNIS